MIRFLTILLVGCGNGADDDSSIDGAISLLDREEAANVSWNRAFFAESGNAMLAFITGVQGANCSDIGDFLSSSDGATEKEGIYDGGGCVMTVKVNDWSGRYETAWNPSSSEWNPAVDSAIRCEFGDGSWELGVNSSGREDHYWTGRTWSGHPTSFSWSFEPDGDSLLLEMDMDAYEGSLIYESTGDVAATGELSGVVKAEPCAAMETASVL